MVDALAFRGPLEPGDAVLLGGIGGAILGAADHDRVVAVVVEGDLHVAETVDDVTGGYRLAADQRPVLDLCLRHDLQLPRVSVGKGRHLAAHHVDRTEDAGEVQEEVLRRRVAAAVDGGVVGIRGAHLGCLERADDRKLEVAVLLPLRIHPSRRGCRVQSGVVVLGVDKRHPLIGGEGCRDAAASEWPRELFDDLLGRQLGAIGQGALVAERGPVLEGLCGPPTGAVPALVREVESEHAQQFAPVRARVQGVRLTALRFTRGALGDDAERAVPVLRMPVGADHEGVAGALVGLQLVPGQILVDADEGVVHRLVERVLHVPHMWELEAHGERGPGGQLELEGEVAGLAVGPQIGVLDDPRVLQVGPVVPAAWALEEPVVAVALVGANDVL